MAHPEQPARARQVGHCTANWFGSGGTVVAVALVLTTALTAAGLRLAAADSELAKWGELPAAEVNSPPESLRIPASGLDTERIVTLRQAPTGVMEVPAEADSVGWFDTSPTPGAEGVSVISGYTRLGYQSGAFHELGRLHPGDTVTVDRADDTTVAFTVYRIKHTADAPNTDALAKTTTDRPELRLLTWRPEGVGEHSLVVFASAAHT